MTRAIYRKEVRPGEPFRAPRHITFGYQAHRVAFSVWFESGAEEDCEYVVLGSGRFIEGYALELVATAVLPDGFHAFHLVRLSKLIEVPA